MQEAKEIKQQFENRVKDIGFKSISDFSKKTNREPVTVFNHCRSGVFDIRKIRAYAKDLKLTFFEVLSLFGINEECNSLEVAKSLGFEGNNSVLSKGNKMICCNNDNTFHATSTDVINSDSTILVKANLPNLPKEIIEHLIKKSICSQ